MKNPLKPKTGSHWINNRGQEMVIASILTLIGLCLLWDAFDNRGRKMPFPMSGLAPW